MNQPQDDIRAAVPEPARRSRWQRFSPSMGWAAFWSEILIVVLGVVIALAANEAVEQWSWRNKVRDAEARLQGDMNRVFAWSAEQYTVQPCINAQIDGHARRVMDSGKTLTPAPVYLDYNNQIQIRNVVRMPSRPWRFGVWESLVADGTASHFSQARQSYYNDVDSQASSEREFRVDSTRLIGRLAALAYPTELDPSVRREFLVDLESLRRQTTMATIISANHMRSTVENNNPHKPEAVEAYVNDSGTVQFCKEHGLPLADWRKFRETNASITTPTQVKAP